MAIGALIGIGSSLIGGIGAGRAARKARRRQRRLMKQIAKLEDERQDIINPYEGVKDMLSNPFANLTVADQAAQMQAQQTDLSLASTLDTLRATGSGAGGATALAQAALQSKQGIAASIQQQEAQNDRLRAQGEAQLQSQLADAEVKGRQFVFDATERREVAKLNRLSSLAGAASQQAAAASSSANQMFGQALGGIGGMALTGGFDNLFSNRSKNLTPVNTNIQTQGLTALTTPDITASPIDFGSLAPNPNVQFDPSGYGGIPISPFAIGGVFGNPND
jgi:hypothetical protein